MASIADLRRACPSSNIRGEDKEKPMFARKSLPLFTLFGLLLAACAPASVEVEPVLEHVVVTQIVEGETVQVVVTATSGETYEYAPEPAAEGPKDNFFQDYGYNDFVDPAEDPFSTFAIDVDTASYTVARRYVEDGLIPPPEAVRVEEFVNYFNQHYETPTNNAFALYADGAPSPFVQDGTYILRFAPGYGSQL
jgi:hypothetical protein